jgi:hypothetical protein
MENKQSYRENSFDSRELRKEWFAITELAALAQKRFEIQESYFKKMDDSFDSFEKQLTESPRTVSPLLRRGVGGEATSNGTQSRTNGKQSRTNGKQSRAIVTQSRTIGTQSRTIGTQSRTIGKQSRTIGTQSRTNAQQFPVFETKTLFTSQ